MMDAAGSNLRYSFIPSRYRLLSLLFVFPAPREQINQVTSWLDASQVYGSSTEEAERIRDHRSTFKFNAISCL